MSAPSTQVVTGPVRLSYVHLFEPWSGADGSQEPSYGCVIMIPKSDKATLRKLKEARAAAIEQGKGKFGGKVPKNLATTLRDGDDEVEDNPEYAGFYVMNCRSKSQPKVVDANVQPILDSTEVYSGIWARVAIAAWAYNRSGNQGVSFFLNHVQKLRDDEPFGNITRPEDVFDAVDEDEDDEPMDGLI